MTDRSKLTADQLDRWHKRPCARCGRHRFVHRRWPDGPVCWTCHDRALRVRGNCPGCCQDRALPGLDPAGQPICTDCAGIRDAYFCARCGHEGRLHAAKLCTRCSFSDRLTELLADDTGQVPAHLKPLFDILVGMDNPVVGWSWLYRPHVPRFLRGLASGEIPLTHEAFAQLQPWRAAAYLRELLMSCGLLPAVDKQLLLFERWLAEHLTTITNPDSAQLVRRFTTWQVLPWLRAKAQRRPLAYSTRRTAGARTMRATEFMAWLKAHDLALATTTQADLDTWHATHSYHQRQSVRTFLTWAMRNQLMPTLDIPRTIADQGQPITQTRRLQLLRRLLVDDDLDLVTRVAAILVLLYAQPFTRIVQLTIDDIVDAGDEVLIRFGDPPTPVPEPFASLIMRLRDQRPNMRTATNPNATWLFPGRRAGQPLHPWTIGQQVKKAGIPSVAGRIAALRQLVLQAPAPVVADALGVHYVTAHRHHAQAGGTWSRYAPGDHGH